MKNRKWLLGCACWSLGAAAADYDLARTLQAALAQEPGLQQKREQVRATDASLRKSWSLLAPAIDFNSSVTAQKDAQGMSQAKRADGSYGTYRSAFSLTQPLLRGSALWSELQRAEIELESRRLDVTIAERDLQARSIRAFYALLLAETLQASYQQQQRILEETLQTAESRWRIGNERELAVLQIRTELALLKPKITEAAQSRDSAALDLAYLVGAPADPDQVHVTGKLSPPDWTALSRALRGEPPRQKLEIRGQQLALDQFEKSRQVTMSAHWPSLSATASLGREGASFGQLLDAPHTQWSAGLQLSLPLFSGLSSFRDREILASQAATLKLGLRQISSQADTELKRAEKGLEESNETVHALQAALELAQKSVPLAKKQYGFGTATYTQLSDAQNNLLQAELALDQARHTMIDRMVDYFVAAGWPLERLAAGLGGRLPAGD